MKENQKSKYLIKVGNHSNLKFLCETDDLEEAKNKIQKYIKENIKHCYYTRLIFHDMHIWIDYGRYTDFIYVYFLDTNAKREYLGEELWKKLNS